MADSYLERVAGELADLALADEARTADINIINTIAEVLGASSQTLQEAYLTAVRVRRAETRAREILIERGGEVVVSQARRIAEGEGDADAQHRDTTQFAQPRQEDTDHKDTPAGAQSASATAPDAPADPQGQDNQTPDAQSGEDMLEDVMDMLGNAFSSTGDGSSKDKDDAAISPTRPKRH